MATTSAPFVWFDKGDKNLNIADLLTDDIRLALVTSAYTPNAVTHEFFDVSVTNELPTANGYTAGGIALASKALNAGASAGTWVFTSANPLWTVTPASITARLFILYNNTPTSNKPLLGYGYLDWNGGTPQDVTTLAGANLTINVPALGWFTITRTNA